MKRMVRVRMAAIALVVSVVIAVPSPACGAELIKAYTVGQESGVWSGIQARVAVLGRPKLSVSYGYRVNALECASRDGRKMAEVGWCSHSGDTWNYLFAAWMRDGIQSYEKIHSGIPTDWTDHTFQLNRKPGSSSWFMYFDGAQQAGVYIRDFTDGSVWAMTELFGYSGDSNNGHFWAMKRFNATTSAWQPLTGLFCAEDDTRDMYHYHRITGTEFYSYPNSSCTVH